MRSMLIRAAAPAAALAALLAAPALAQEAGGAGQEQMQMQGQGSVQFEDAKLQSFAAAASGIRDVARVYAPRLQEAESAEQASDLQQEAETAMMKEVETEDLTVEEYNQIAVAAQQDPQLAATIEGYITNGTGGEGTTD